ncbi:MAG: DNA-directed RNA polymerase subunit omega [bacterium]
MTDSESTTVNLYSKKCKYSLVMAVVKRAKELNRIARQRNLSVKEVSYSDYNLSKPVPLALDEILQEKVNVVEKKKPAYSPEVLLDENADKLLNTDAILSQAISETGNLAAPLNEEGN